MQRFLRGGKWLTREQLKPQEIVEETTEADSIDVLREKYQVKFSKDVPVNKKNDEQWIISKL